MEIIVTIYPDITDTTPTHSRKGRATFGIKVPKKDQTCEYKVSVVYVYLFDPEDENILNDLAEAKAEEIPLDNEMVTFDINLGLGLHEKLKKSRSKELELQFKIQLHLKQIYTMRDLYLPSGSCYGNIVRSNQL